MLTIPEHQRNRKRGFDTPYRVKEDACTHGACDLAVVGKFNGAGLRDDPVNDPR